MADASATPGRDAPRRAPGRPRSARADDAILDAALQLLVETGFDAMSIEGIAARAGVGKTTIYRRWSSKDAVAAAALRRVTASVPTPDTGDLRADLLALAHGYREAILSTVVGPAIRRVLSAAITTPELLAIFRDTMLAPREAAIVAALRRAQARGEARADLEPAVVVNMLAGPLIFQALFRAEPDPPAPDAVERVVDVLLHGIAAG